MKRYSYTPRRNGHPVASRTMSPQGGLFPLVVPIVLILGVIIAVAVLTRGSGDLSAVSCQNPPCDRALALGASGVPTLKATASPPTPVRSPYPVPAISGLSAVILDEPCGKQIYAFNENTRYPPASLVKLMTALVAANHANLNDIITSPLDGFALSQENDGTVMGIELGQKLSLRDLLYGLLLRSGNDAALVIAQYVGGSEEGFVKMMNDEAASLGLKDTRFTNPHGLDNPRLFVSAHDIAIIGHEVLEKPALAEIVRTTSYTPNWDNGALENINLFLTNYPGAIGLKTGFTPTANQTIVAAATRDDRTLLVSVLHSIDEYVDASVLLEWAFDNTDRAC